MQKYRKRHKNEMIIKVYEKIKNKINKDKTEAKENFEDGQN